MSNDISGLVKFDEVMQKFESTSGAILSRNNKSKVIGVGLWKGKQDWPEKVRWMKVVTFVAAANHSFLSPRGLAAVHLTDRSCHAHNLVLDCTIYFYAFFFRAFVFTTILRSRQVEAFSFLS